MQARMAVHKGLVWLLVPEHVTLGLTVMGPPWLLLQLAPLVLQATSQVQLVQELLVVLYVQQEGTAQPPTLGRVLFAVQAGMAQVVAIRLLVLIHVTLELTVMGSPWLRLQLAPLALQATTQVQLVQELLVVLYAE